jgi:hypothetical protein
MKPLIDCVFTKTLALGIHSLILSKISSCDKPDSIASETKTASKPSVPEHNLVSIAEMRLPVPMAERPADSALFW